MRLIGQYLLPTWLILIGSAFFGYPALVVHLNPPPSESSLIGFRGKILSSRDTQPNIVLTLKNGASRSFQFPTPLYSVMRNQRRFNGLSMEQQTALTGCDAVIYSAPVKFVWPHIYRVWKIDCGSRSIPYSQVADYFVSQTEKEGRNQWFGAVVIAFVTIATTVQAYYRKSTKSVGHKALVHSERIEPH